MKRKKMNIIRRAGICGALAAALTAGLAGCGAKESAGTAGTEPASASDSMEAGGEETRIAAGADGLIIEVHPNPKVAMSDAAQQLTIPDYGRLVQRAGAVAQALGRTL